MELTSDLITLQGILSGVIKSTGDFTKIKYRGGKLKVFTFDLFTLKLLHF